MRIVYLAAANSIHTIRWINELSNRGHSVYLIYLPNHSGELDKINSSVQQYKLAHAGSFGYYLNASQVRKIIKRINPDVINAHYASGYGTLARMARCHPLVLSVWGSDVYDFPYHNVLNNIIVKRNLNYANAIASTSNIMAKQVKRIIKKDRNIHITPFGVDTSLYFKKDIHESNFIKIGVIKTLSSRYRISDIIYTMKIIFELYGNKVTLDIYGDGSDKINLEELSSRLGLDSIITFKGKIPNNEVPKVLNELDIFIVSSNHESFGVAVVEAMAAQLPVVASDVDGFREVIGNSNAGFLVEVGNHKQMAQKLIDLIENVEMRALMGENGLQRVKKHYEWSLNVDMMEELYYQVVCENNRCQL